MRSRAPPAQPPLASPLPPLAALFTARHRNTCSIATGLVASPRCRTSSSACRPCSVIVYTITDGRRLVMPSAHRRSGRGAPLQPRRPERRAGLSFWASQSSRHLSTSYLSCGNTSLVRRSRLAATWSLFASLEPVNKTKRSRPTAMSSPSRSTQ